MKKNESKNASIFSAIHDEDEIKRKRAWHQLAPRIFCASSAVKIFEIPSCEFEIWGKKSAQLQVFDAEPN